MLASGGEGPECEYSREGQDQYFPLTSPVHLPLAGPSPAPLGRDREGRSGAKGRQPVWGSAAAAPPRPAACTPGPAAASRKARTRSSRENRGYASRPRRRSGPPGPPPGRPAAPAPLTRALQVVAGLHGGSPAAAPVGAAAARVSRGGRACRGPPLTPPSPARPRARREARPGRGVRLPEGRPGAGASPSREPGCGRPAGMTSEPTRRCVTARAGSVRSA